jgi:hypothetical protein
MMDISIFTLLAVALITGLLALFRGGLILFKYGNGYLTLALLTVLRGLVVVTVTGFAFRIYFNKLMNFEILLVIIVILGLMASLAAHITEARYGQKLRDLTSSKQ